MTHDPRRQLDIPMAAIPPEFPTIAPQVAMIAMEFPAILPQLPPVTPHVAMIALAAVLTKLTPVPPEFTPVTPNIAMIPTELPAVMPHLVTVASRPAGILPEGLLGAERRRSQNTEEKH